ncbi:aldo/keto reductase [Frankia sp. AgB1.9]|uniref:aldo/keto reductase n=1 Tax=unclassified Frankia TaxID=2632575 RepID=UPI0019332D94|nr:MULTISPECIES: aldo/keto reductase [unclassified Frankia]MBL7491028.1 aldo/keto reductase [Frankia sp. AgW1.1]MBL7548169.1 aldo/keto reductase [Frankia sp. AgB1.9]MBL7620395.1 aldo/keto reductase [Frankia sp. AgB1.8]
MTPDASPPAAPRGLPVVPPPAWVHGDATTLRQRVLGRSGIRVSEFALGTMTFGTRAGWGSDESVCREIYAAFREAGGTFVDTANNYAAGESEEIVGRLVAAERDDLVVASKFTLPTNLADPNSGGSSRKTIRGSVERSLRRLGTDYLDVLWVHAWDRNTPVEETLRALDDLVHAGKVLAIGLSNMPAWVIAHAATLVSLRGWSPVAAVQVEYSLLARTADREMLPMADAFGLAVAAWSPLGRGRLVKAAPANASVPAAQARAVEALGQVADELEATPASVAIAWVMAHGLLPTLGVSSVKQLADSLAAARLTLTADQLTRLDAATEVRLGYPHEFLRDRCPTLAPPPPR